MNQGCKIEHVEQLRQLFRRLRMDDVQGMNWLQDCGAVSDNCVKVEQVAECDAVKVLEMFAEMIESHK